MKTEELNAAVLRARHDQVTERLRRERDAALEDLEGAERALRAERRKVKALQSELDEKYRANRNFQVAERIFEFWRVKTGHERAEFLERRQKQTLWALKHYTPRECCMAILGCVHRGFTDPGTHQKHDELAMILRDETMVDKNIERYRIHCLEAGVRFDRDGPAGPGLVAGDARPAGPDQP